MGREQKTPGLAESLDITLGYLSLEVIKNKSLIQQATLRAQIKNIKLIKETINKGDCF